jgi:hypothetical protein
MIKQKPGDEPGLVFAALRIGHITNPSLIIVLYLLLKIWYWLEPYLQSEAHIRRSATTDGSRGGVF